jgi:hypothetical protein
MKQQRLAQAPLERLDVHHPQSFPDPEQWEAHLRRLGITKQRHRRIATEGALLGSVLHHGLSPQLAIISDDAGQFDVLLHGLCWVHAERLVHKLIPLNDDHRQDIDRARDQIWMLYAEIKAYKAQPRPDSKAQLQTRFDAIFTQKTCFETSIRPSSGSIGTSQSYCSSWTAPTSLCIPTQVRAIFVSM